MIYGRDMHPQKPHKGGEQGEAECKHELRAQEGVIVIISCLSMSLPLSLPTDLQ